MNSLLKVILFSKGGNDDEVIMSTVRRGGGNKEVACRVNVFSDKVLIVILEKEFFYTNESPLGTSLVM